MRDLWDVIVWVVEWAAVVLWFSLLFGVVFLIAIGAMVVFR